MATAMNWTGAHTFRHPETQLDHHNNHMPHSTHKSECEALLSRDCVHFFCSPFCCHFSLLLLFVVFLAMVVLLPWRKRRPASRSEMKFIPPKATRTTHNRLFVCFSFYTVWNKHQTIMINDDWMVDIQSIRLLLWGFGPQPFARFSSFHLIIGAQRTTRSSSEASNCLTKS